MHCTSVCYGYWGWLYIWIKYCGGECEEIKLIKKITKEHLRVLVNKYIHSKLCIESLLCMKIIVQVEKINM
jgi:hypothetical protein